MSKVSIYDIVWDGKDTEHLPTTYDLTDYGVTTYNFRYGLVQKIIENLEGHTIASYDFIFNYDTIQDDV